MTLCENKLTLLYSTYFSFWSREFRFFISSFVVYLLYLSVRFILFLLLISIIVTFSAQVVLSLFSTLLYLISVSSCFALFINFICRQYFLFNLFPFFLLIKFLLSNSCVCVCVCVVFQFLETIKSISKHPLAVSDNVLSRSLRETSESFSKQMVKIAITYIWDY